MPKLVPTLLALVPLALLAVCDEAGTDPCDGPTIWGCAGEPCSYGHIYDEDGGFVSEGYGGATGQLYWDGTDCRGDEVPCGLYRLHVFVVSGGVTVGNVSEFLVTDGAGSSATGVYSCDSLAVACAGTYHEIDAESPWGYPERQCVCCQ